MNLTEPIRRILLAAGILLAVWLALRPVPALVRVGYAEWAEEQRRRPGWDERSRLPLDEYVAGETRDRLVAAAGPEWEALLRAAADLAAGRGVGPELERRAGGMFEKDALYFRPDEPPLSALAGAPGPGRTFTYAAVPSGAGVEHLELTWLPAPDARHGAPAAILFPGRRYALWVLGAALALYVLLPWPRFADGMVRYSRVRAAILPDLIGAMLLTLFFAMPLFVVAGASVNASLFEGGWTVLTLVGWGMAIFGLVILGIAAWYATFRVQLLPDGLRAWTLGGTEEYPFAQIREVRGMRYEIPRWLLWAGIVVSLLNWRAAGPTLIQAGRSDAGIEVVRGDGRVLRVWLTGLLGARGMLDALRKGGVAVPEEVRELVREGAES